MDSFAPSDNRVLREALTAQLLGRVADSLDITPTQFQRAKLAYETISEVVTSSADPRLAAAKVFPQGSFAIGTIVRPLNDAEGEFDVDLACRLAANTSLTPTMAKGLVGAPLKADGRYADKLEEKTRCWCVNYTGEFHLDICPLVRATATDAIPDKDLAMWILTHPEEYAKWFNESADRARTRLLKDSAVLKAEVAPFPEENADKGWLRRIVQLLKRHRDTWCLRVGSRQAEFAPISIIITTLAAMSFERELRSGRQFTNPYNLIQRVMAGMPAFIEQRNIAGRVEWWIQSPVAAENFANRWNQDQRWVIAFREWHTVALASVHELVSVTGLDGARPVLDSAFGASTATKAINSYSQQMRSARDGGVLRFSPAAGGLTVSSAIAGTPITRHTFFGD